MMSTRSYGTGPSPDEYGGDYENQLVQEDTLIERRIDDELDDGISPRHLGTKDSRTGDNMT